MISDFLKSNWRSSWLVNRKLEWQFLDEYTFFPSYESGLFSDGIVIVEGKSYAAEITIKKNRSKEYEATLSYGKSNNIQIESIELKTANRLKNEREF